MSDRLSFRELVRSDLCRSPSYTRTLSGFIRAYLNAPSFRYCVYLRACQVLGRRRGPLYRSALVLTRLLLKRYSIMYGFQFGHRANVGPGLMLPHHGRVIVNGAAIIGANVTIHPGAVIAQADRGRRQGVPRIGDRVWIGPNAVIVGKVSVGDDALIAPLSYVNDDVEAGSVVAGSPAVRISGRGSQGYIEPLWPGPRPDAQDPAPYVPPRIEPPPP
jgi:serine O-acetyltransferase